MQEDNKDIEQIKNSEVDELNQKITELNDKYISLYADKENMQKRLTNEILNITKYKDESLAKDLFLILDDFERCIDSIKDEKCVDGIKLIYDKMINVLKQHNIEQIIPNEGEIFTTDTMEAVALIPNEQNSGKVVTCTQNGYKFPERVIRYAKVVVGQ